MKHTAKGSSKQGLIMTIVQESPLNIGIVGGGLIGSFATIVLSTLPNVQVTTFEKAESPREVGAAIGISESGLEILSKFIDIDEFHSLTATPGVNSRYSVKHWKTDDVLSRQNPITKTDLKFWASKTHRSALLKLFLKYVPKGSIKYGYKVTDINFSDDKISLRFDQIDQLQHFDLVIAADGIYSGIRSKIYPDNKVVSRGTVAYRNIFPEEHIKQVQSFTQPERTVCYTKPGIAAFLSELGLGKYGLGLIITEPKEIIDKLKWDKTVTEQDLERLKERLKDWPQPVREVIEASPYLSAYPLESAQWLDHLTYKDKLVFIGDAAHPTSGAYGSGAAFGIGDVWALYRSIQETGSNAPKRKRAALNNYEFKESEPDVYDLKTALFLFDETRRYFLKDVYEQIERDKKNGAYIKESSKDEQEEIEKSIHLANASAWLYEHNVELEFQRIRAKNIHVLYK